MAVGRQAKVRPIRGGLLGLAGCGVLVLIMALYVNTARPSAVSRVVSDTAASHANALWHIVHDLCAVDMKVRGHPAPCAAVNLSGGYAVLKDIQGPTQYLLIPTARVRGIESPDLLAPGSPNYWRAAWAARALFESKVGHPVARETIGLAINSAYGRSQNQLHIHIDCVRPDVVQAIRARGADIGPRWTDWPGGLFGHPYRARWVDGADLGARDPFKLLARGDPIARMDMGRETLVVVGASRPDGAPGFVLLADRANLGGGDSAAGEELLDHGCSVLAQPSPTPTPTPTPSPAPAP